MAEAQKIRVEVLVKASLEEAWDAFVDPKAVRAWNFASPDWCCPKATNDLRLGGVFSYRMESRDGSMGFDFWGTYTEITPGQSLAYTLGDGRKVVLDFSQVEGKTKLVETFEPESENPEELQRTGWQAILNNYKEYAERARE